MIISNCYFIYMYMHHSIKRCKGKRSNMYEYCCHPPDSFKVRLEFCDRLNVPPFLSPSPSISIPYPTRLNRLLVFRNCARHGIMFSCSSSLFLCKLSVDACLLLLLWEYVVPLVPLVPLPLRTIADAADAESSVIVPWPFVVELLPLPLL